MGKVSTRVTLIGDAAQLAVPSSTSCFKMAGFAVLATRTDSNVGDSDLVVRARQWSIEIDFTSNVDPILAANTAYETALELIANAKVEDCMLIGMPNSASAASVTKINGIALADMVGAITSCM